MLKGFRLPLLAAALAVAPATARAEDDAALLARLAGNWVGEWAFDANVKGKLTATFTVDGTKVKGKTMWFATAVGDFGDEVQRAKVSKGVIRVTEATMDFEVTFSEDGLSGTWTSPMATGTLKLKKQE
ncbi:hypothetical protein [Mesoterricola sediminis]|uniref:DUF1579 domain-containing protein n=1 Tax=Mesoterricola sediminis TaxID=2927980 RepID=A0AA48GQW9_9BACT|nr:hypothetical protein [Mesoterricola sediminis]BDU77606.1 hypothetical protein METESE_25640 [Mesoterricola sediminis]